MITGSVDAVDVVGQIFGVLGVAAAQVVIDLVPLAAQVMTPFLYAVAVTDGVA